jgi:hypothetical protein
MRRRRNGHGDLLCLVSPRNKPFDRGRIHKLMKLNYLVLADLDHIVKNDMQRSTSLESRAS